MFTTPEFIRELKRGEEANVTALLTAAFGQKDEAMLVDALRKSRAMAGEMVLPMGGEIVGYAGLSHMIAPKGWLCLAPVAIRPDLHGHGYGKRLIGMIAQWAEMARATVVVLGDTAFYSRAGFTPISTGFTSPYPLAHTLTVGPTQTKEAALIYPKAFG